MKVTCPHCKKVLDAPPEWAGKKVRCPGCRKPVKLPASHAGPSKEELGFDLDSLATIESSGHVVVRDRNRKPLTLKEAQAAAVQTVERKAVSTDPTVRFCPQCAKVVRCDDVYAELICAQCGADIPSLMTPKSGYVKYNKDAGILKTKINFYNGFTGAVLYPLPGITAILIGMAAALGMIALPVVGAVGIVAVSNLNEVAKKTEVTWLGTFMFGMFILEGVLFGALAYYLMIDTIRATSGGHEQPPPLTWNISRIGSALGGYLALVVFYVLAILALLSISGKGFPSTADDLAPLMQPGHILILVLLTLPIPMNIIGLASGNMLNGFNPAKILLSIAKLAGHYLFLYLIVVLYMGLYIGLMIAVMNWAAPKMMEAASRGIQAGFLNLIIGALAWTVLVGLGFYFAYVLGRILGLFARTYRSRLAFEL